MAQQQQQEDGGRQLLELAAERLLQADARKTASSSNYDFIKIKVRLGTHLEHYYILSRFLLSRMLTVITLPQHKVRLPAAAPLPASSRSNFHPSSIGCAKHCCACVATP